MSSSSSPNATNARINDNIMNNNTSSSSSNTTTTSPFFKRQMIPCPPKYLLNYNMKKIFVKDIVAGVTVGFMAVPQAMSYATVAGLPPVFGLYNAFIGLLPYFLFGSSAYLITGPTAVMSILVDGTIPKHPAHNVTIHTGADACDMSHTASELSLDCKVRVSMALTLSLMAGIFQILLGYFKLGILSDLMSSPVIVGFTSGAAFLIASTQFSSILGISKCKNHEPCYHGLPLIDNVSNIFEKFHTIDGDTLLFGSCAVVILIAFKNLPYLIKIIKGKCCNNYDDNNNNNMNTIHYDQLGHPNIDLDVNMLNEDGDKKNKNIPTSARLNFFSKLGPITLLVGSILCMTFLNWPIKTVGSVCDTSQDKSIFHSECLPTIMWPSSYAEKVGYPLYAEDVVNLIGPAIAVALVGYVESMSIAKTVAKIGSSKTRLDSNQELIALGACNLLCGLFSGYPVTGSFSRTAVNHASGAKTQVASVAAALTVGVALIFFTPFLQHVPKVSLAAIVIVAILKLIKLWTAIKYFHLNRRDFFVFLVSFLATLILNIQPALVVAVLTSWVFHLVKFTHSAIAIVNVQNIVSQTRLERDDFKWFAEDDPDLYYNIMRTKEHFALVIKIRHSLEFSTAQHFRTCLERISRLDQIPASVILDFSSVAHVDVTGLETLIDALNAFKASEIPLQITCASKPVYNMFQNATNYADGKKHVNEFQASRQSLNGVLQEIPNELASRYTALTKTKRTPGKIEEDLFSP